MAFFFISYAREDQSAAEGLHAHLRTWGFSSLFLDIDPSDGITVGSRWRDELFSRILSADALIFLGSPSSIASRWCFAELALAQFSSKPIIPLWLRGTRPPDFLPDIQWLDVTAGDTAFEHLRRTLVERFGPRAGFFWDHRRPPYPGLAPFQPEDAAMFFGREDKIAEVTRGLEPSGVRGRSITIVGPSGSGKSSLVRGGVVPRLRRSADTWAVIPPFVPGERPLASLSRALASALAVAGTDVDRNDLHQLLASDVNRLADAVMEISSSERGARRAVLIVVDQAEELISISDLDERARFLSALQTALAGRSPLRLLSTLRTEVLDTALSEPAFAGLIEETVLLGPLDRARLSQVIEGPGQTAGLRFAPGLVVRMVDDTSGGDGLPLLAYTLRQLIDDGKPAGGLITHDAYEAIGGVLGALEARADAARRDVERAGHDGAVLPTLLRLVTLNAEDEPTRRRLRHDRLTEAQRVVVDAFVDARLLTIDGQVVEVAHEALLRAWRPLREAIAASRQSLRVQASLTHSAQEWDETGRPDGLLLPAERLQRVEGALIGTSPDRLTGVESEYYEASVDLRRRRTKARRRRRNLTSVAAAVVIAVLATTSILAFWQRQAATAQANLADSRGLAAAAIASFDDKPELGMLLAIEAWRAADTIEARNAALTMTQRGEGLDAVFRNSNESKVAAAAFSPIEALMAADGGDQTILLWDLRTRATRGDPLRLPESDKSQATYGISALAFSPDGKTLCALYYAGAIALWRLDGDAAPRAVRLPSQKIGQAVRIAFSPDGATLAATAFNGDVALWNVADAKPIGTPRGQVRSFGETAIAFADAETVVAFNYSVSNSTDPTVTDSDGGLLTRWPVHGDEALTRQPLLPKEFIYSSALTTDGNILVTFGRNSGLNSWDTRSGQRLAHSERPEIEVTADLVFDRSGTRLAAITEDGHIELFDVPSLKLSAIQPPKLAANGIGFSPDGRLVAMTGRGSTTIWDIARPLPLGDSLYEAPPANGVLDKDLAATVGMSKSDPARLIAVTKGKLRAWRLPNRTPTEVPAPEYIQGVAISSDGGTTAVLDYDDGLTTWHPGDQRLSPIGTMDPVASLALSENGDLLASGGDADNGQIRLWDPRSGAELPPSMRHDEAVVWTLAFSPKADLLTSAGYGGDISVWKVIRNRDGSPRLRAFEPNRPFVGHTGAVMSVAFDPTGSRLVSGGSDGSVRLWDVATRKAFGEPLSAGSSVNRVVFAPDGRTIAAATGNGLRLWDAATRRPLGLTVTTRGGLADVSFGADGRRLASIDDYGGVVVWDPVLWSADPSDVTERLCSIASRNLTHAEWRQFLPEKPYHSTCPRWTRRS